MIQDTKVYKQLINEGILALIKIQTETELLDSIADTIQQKCDIPKAQAKQHIKTAFKKVYENEKYTTDKLRVSELYTAMELLDA